jgi:conjugative relaxase-like TrwC/TraI family protein
MGWHHPITAHVVAYHRDGTAVPGGVFDYYTGEDSAERPLVWRGPGAEHLGLTGTVTRGEYDAIFAPGGAGHPVSGEQLARTLRPGTEITIATPKSVSVLWALGGEHRRAAEAILDAMASAEVDYLDRVAKTVGGRRGHAGVERTGTHGLVYCTADHYLSRSLDPHLHRHVLVANLVTRDDDGATRALDMMLLTGLRHGSTMAGRLAGAYAAHQLAYHLEPEADANGQLTEWRITGVPRELEDAWSKRSADIDDLARRRGVEATDYAARQAIARQTRRAKQRADIAEREAVWQADLARCPVDLVHDMDLPRPDPAHIEQKRFHRQDVEWAVGPSLYGRHPALLDVEVDRRLADMAAVELARVDVFRGRLHTTLIALEREHQIRDLVEAMIEEDRLQLIVGVAGSGKTTAAAERARRYEGDGWTVVGTATSGAAARNLGHTADLSSSTIAGLRRSLDSGRRQLSDRTLVVADEAGMIDDPDTLYVLRAAHTAGSRVLLVGDHRQLSAVGPGGSFEALVERWPDAICELTDNRRQVDPGERDALDQLRSGDVDVAVDWYRHHGRILTAPDWTDAIELAADRWADQGDDASLYAHRRTNVAALNQACRRRMADAGRVDLEREVEGFAPGDRVVQLASDHARGLVNSQRGIVVHSDPHGHSLDVVWDDGRRLTLSGDALDEHHLALGYATTVHKSQGATADRAVLFADGGGRELAYVGMSRARHGTQLVAVADNIDQAAEQLRDDWHTERRERWLLDTEQTLSDALDRIERTTADRLAKMFDESVADPLTPLQRAMTRVREQEDALQLER